MPAMPSSLLEPLWQQFSVLLPKRSEFDPAHPLGCHRRRVPDETVFRLVVEALVHGSGYERVAITGCSDWTIRNPVKHWSALGLAQELHRIALAAYDKMIGLGLSELSVDGCQTKAPCRGDKAGPSPADRAKQGLKRSTLIDSGGIPIGLVSAGANRHDSVLLGPAIDAARHQVGNLPADATVHLDSAPSPG